MEQPEDHRRLEHAPGFGPGAVAEAAQQDSSEEDLLAEPHAHSGYEDGRQQPRREAAPTARMVWSVAQLPSTVAVWLSSRCLPLVEWWADS